MILDMKSGTLMYADSLEVIGTGTMTAELEVLSEYIPVLPISGECEITVENDFDFVHCSIL